MSQKILNKIRSVPARLFFFRLFIIILIISLLDFTIGAILRHFYFSQQSGVQYRTTFAINSTEADLVVFGSSRANHHYYPVTFEEKLKLTYYNAGRDGCDILYHYAVLKSVLKRYTPKVVILDFTDREFINESAGYDRLSALLPYYKNHPEIRSIVNLKSKFERLKMMSSIYPFNSDILTIAVGNTDFNKRRSADLKGYVALNKKWTQPVKAIEKRQNYKLDSNKIRVYEQFIQECVNAQITLYIVSSPYYIRHKQPDLSAALAKDIARKHDITFIDYTQNTAFVTNDLFADEEHLNNSGALLFSQMVADSITRLNNHRMPTFAERWNKNKETSINDFRQ